MKLFQAGFLVLGLAVLISACANSSHPGLVNNNDHGIIGASKIDPKKALIAPNVVLLKVFKDDSGWYTKCTGTLIGEQIVLTAGHCIHEVRDLKLKAILHSAKSGNSENEGWVYPSIVVESPTGAVGSGVAVALPKSIVLSDFETRDDIGLIKLAEPLRPIDANGAEAVKVSIDRKGLAKPGARVLAIGYGYVEKKGDKHKSDGLQKKNFQVVSPKSLGLVNTDGDDAIFLTNIKGDKQGMTCQGDSGGPFLMIVEKKPIVVGVTSRGDADCMVDTIGTATAVYAKWITKQAETWSIKLN